MTFYEDKIQSKFSNCANNYKLDTRQHIKSVLADIRADRTWMLELQKLLSAL